MKLDPGMVESSKRKTIVKLHDIYSWNFHEIGDVFDISHAQAYTIWSITKRGRQDYPSVINRKYKRRTREQNIHRRAKSAQRKYAKCWEEWAKGVFTVKDKDHEGVHWHKLAGKWRAQITFNGKTKHLGLFVKLDDAIAAYNIEKNRKLGFIKV